MLRVRFHFVDVVTRLRLHPDPDHQTVPFEHLFEDGLQGSAELRVFRAAGVGELRRRDVVLRVTEFDWAAGAFAEGVRLYRSGKFFEAHETWESLWLAAGEPEKTFLQGLIQVTAAFHHVAHGNVRGARLLLERALRRFEDYPPSFGGVSVTTLRDDIRDRVRMLAASQPGAILHPVRLVAS